MTSDLPFIHDRAICETDRIGARTRIWAFAHILPNVTIGEDCNICDGVFIETGASVGDRVTIKCGVQLWDGVRLEDDVFVGPNVTFTNNPFPRSRMYLAEHPVTVVEKGSSIGGNATILPGVRIGAGAMIGAGAVVTRDVPPGAVMVGNPARELDRPASSAPARRYHDVADCRIISMRSFADSRGKLMPIEAMQDIPFTPQRLFIISEVPADAGRGAHANLLSDQIIIPVAGGLTVTVFDGKDEAKFRLDTQEQGLFVPATVWNDLSEFAADSRILVLASQPYDEAQYIRDRVAYSDIRKAQA